jgi:hypothetical protein
MKTTMMAAVFAAAIFISCKKETAGNSTEPDTGSVALVHYEFANSLADISGNGFNGTADTSIDFVPDRFSRMNQAIRFNGPDHNSCFILPALGSKQVSNKFSVSFWFTVTSVNNNNLFYKADVSEGTESGQTVLVSKGRLRIILGNGIDGTKEFDGKNLLEENTWYHAVLAVDGINDIKIYLNGLLYNNQMQTTVSNIMAFAFKNNAAQVQGLLGGKFPYPLTDGKMDDFRLYNRALSAAEVLALYNHRP